MKTRRLFAGISLALVPCAMAQPSHAATEAAPEIETIMSRVAINQATSEEMRRSFVYSQKQLLRLFRANKKIAREERREYVMTPDARGVQKKLVQFAGRYQSSGRFVSYKNPGYEYKNIDIDGSLINSLSEDMTNNRGSRDGISNDLFPLKYHQQLRYTFTLKGRETYRGRQVFRIAFAPKPHQDFDEAMWKGEALIDAEEYQPVWVSTSMAWKMPAAVKIILGTNIRGLGFTISYEKVADGIWFPVSYGGEFEVRGLFFYKRTITVSLSNSDFRRTDVRSSVAFDTDGH